MRLNILIAIVAIVALLSGVYYLFYTTPGSEFMVERVLDHYVEHEQLGYEQLKGNLGQGITFENLELAHIRDLPEGTTIKLQRLYFNLTSFSPDGVEVEIDNARLKLPESEPVVITGTYKQQQLNVNIFSRGFTVTEVTTYLPDLKALIPIRGYVKQIDLTVTGHYLEPRVAGSFTIGTFVYKGFQLTETPIDADIQIKDPMDDVRLFGRVNIKEGKFETKRTIVKLQPGELLFEGPWDQPQMHLAGASKIENTMINIKLKGTAQEPQLSLTSQPPYPKERLMVMLATGKSWQSVDASLEGQFDTGAVTKDFIDYFFFAGKSNKFAERFGISDFSLTLEEGRSGVAAKKDLTDKLQVGFGYEQTKTDGQSADVSQKVGGEYKFNERLSVGVERETKSNTAGDAAEDPVSANDDKVLLKYQKSF